MQGTIVKVLVEVGQEVEVGQGIVVLEAMKMENQIVADKAGTVKEIKVAPGDTVGGGDVVAIDRVATDSPPGDVIGRPCRGDLEPSGRCVWTRPRSSRQTVNPSV